MITAPSRLVAAMFALAGFTVALLAGIAAGNPPLRVLTAAVVGMVVCHVVGLGVGAVGERVVNDHLDAYRKAKPVAQVRPMAAREGAAGAAAGAPGGATA